MPSSAVAFYFTPVSFIAIIHKEAETVLETWNFFFFFFFFLSVSGYRQFQEREDQNLKTFHKGTEIKREDVGRIRFLNISTHKVFVIFRCQNFSYCEAAAR